MDWTTSLLAILFCIPLCWKCSYSFRYYVKFVFFYTSLMVSGLIIVPIAMWKPKDVRNMRPISIMWTFLFVDLPIMEISYEVRNEHHLVSENPCVIVSNHQSSLDVIGLLKYIPERCTFLAKKSLQYAGTFGLGAWLCGLVFVDRSNHQKATQTLNDAINRVRNEKLKLWVFPEGTRSMTGELKPFKKGAFNIAVEAQIPIVPVVFSTYSHFYNKKKKTFGSGKVILQCLPPVSTEGLTKEDVPELAEKVRADMSAIFADISAELPVTAS